MDSVTEEQLWTAYKPLLDLVGVTPLEVFNDPPLRVQWDDYGFAIRFLKNVDPDKPREDWPTVEVGEAPHGELAYDVTIRARYDGFDLRTLWPEPRPEGTPA